MPHRRSRQEGPSFEYQQHNFKFALLFGGLGRVLLKSMITVHYKQNLSRLSERDGTVSRRRFSLTYCYKQNIIEPCIEFPTMWYVRPAKAQTSLRICAVWSEPLLVAWIFYDCKATDWTSFGVSKLNRRPLRLVWV